MRELAETERDVVVYCVFGLKPELVETWTVQDELPVEDQLSVADELVMFEGVKAVGCD